jgi:hypothetical protein
MSRILHFVNDSAIFPLLFLIGVLCYLGRRLAPVGSWYHVWGQRLAVGGFIAFIALSCVESRVRDAEDLAPIVLRALCAAGILLGLVWILFPTCAYLYQVLVKRPLTALRQQREKQLRAAQERQQQLDYERRAPEREAARRAAEEQARIERGYQRRRDDARAQCELFFALHAPEIGKRFPRSKFDEFKNQYLTDYRPAEEVEQRAAQLLALMEEHLHKTGGNAGNDGIAKIAQWYFKEKAEVEKLPLSEEEKQDFFAGLEARFSKLQQDYLRSRQP